MRYEDNLTLKLSIFRRAVLLSFYHKTIHHICFYFSSFDVGGMERMAVNLATGISQLNVQVDFILDKKNAPYISTAHSKINFIFIDKNSSKLQLINTLEQRPPQLLMAFKEEDIFQISQLIKKNDINTTVVARTGTALKSRQKKRKMNFFKRWYTNHKMRKIYRRLIDGHIAVAEGTKQELQEVIQIPADNIKVIKNPVITPALLEQQHQIIEHDWFTKNDIPLIMGMGGFRQQKDFTTLIKAFAQVRQNRPCRLLILGQGRQKDRLKQLCSELNIAKDVCFPGFTDNPYPWLKRADLFVLSSLWEGSPNVLTEALALGTPVVSTDCQSGPRETLQDGRYGELLPLQDPDKMALAIARTLDNPLPAETLKAAVKDYTVEVSSKAYLAAFEHFIKQS